MRYSLCAKQFKDRSCCVKSTVADLRSSVFQRGRVVGVIVDIS